MAVCDHGSLFRPRISSLNRRQQQHNQTSDKLSRFDGLSTKAVHGSRSGNIKPTQVRRQQHHLTSQSSRFDGLSTKAVHGSRSRQQCQATGSAATTLWNISIKPSSLQDNSPFVSALTAVRLYPLAVVPPSTHHGVRRQSLPVAIHFSYNRGSVMSSCLTTIKYRAAKADKKAFLMKNGENLLEKLISASNGETHVKDEVIGAMGFFAPKYKNTDDVSCSRKDPVWLQDFTEIAFKCVSESEEERPTMIDVAKQLSRALCLKFFIFSGLAFSFLNFLILTTEVAINRLYIYMDSFLRKKEYWEKPQKLAFMKNGAILLEKLIASSDGKYNPIQSFSAKEMKRATNNYDAQKVIKTDSLYELYKGFLQDRPVSVMKFKADQGIADPARREAGDQYFLLDHVRKYNERNKFDEIIDPIIVGVDQSCQEKQKQLQDFKDLACKCVSVSIDNRPTMIDVAKKLRQIYRSG
ncbi:hypothetical protein QYF36_007910 [Acer negundo]|nr:hypothetical protein QYF36_007910 [Acer negundo]